MDEEYKDMSIKELYVELRKVRKAINNADPVFVTYQGHCYREKEPCLMVVGMAPAGWEEGDKGDKAADYIENKVIPGHEEKLHFLTFMRQLSQGLYGEDINDDTKESRKKAFRRIVWSNLIKFSIDNIPPNPQRKDLKQTLCICIELIRKEIKYYEPTHLVFCGYWKEVIKILEINEPRYQYDDICKLEAPKYAPVIFSTYHPRAWALLKPSPSIMGREEAIKTIIKS